MILLSVIVPIYNVGRYLRKCVDSLICQDLPADDYEIILVDDGSTDDSGAIADSYSTYPNIRVIHRENGGLSEARNTGIDAATGKYVQFVDSDDYLEPDVLGTLVSKVENDNLDVLRFNYRNVNENYEVFEPNKVHKPFVDYSDNPCDGEAFLNERLGYACYSVQFIIRKELLESCRFTPGILFEDTDWTPRMLLEAKRVSSTDLMVYNYLLRKGSLTCATNTGSKLKIIENQASLIDRLGEISGRAKDKRWFSGMQARTATALLDNVTLNFYGQREKYIKIVRKLLPLRDYHQDKVSAKKMKMINISPRIYCLLLKVKNCL